MTYIKERVIRLARKNGVTVEEFAIKIGMTYSSFIGKAKYTPLNTDAIVNILTFYKDINADWLITGRGEMLKSTSESMVNIPHTNNPDERIKELELTIIQKDAEIKSLKNTIEMLIQTIKK